MRTIIETTTLVTDMILKVIMNFEISLRRVGCMVKVVQQSCISIITSVAMMRIKIALTYRA